jgi:hypothetical protein
MGWLVRVRRSESVRTVLVDSSETPLLRTLPSSFSLWVSSLTAVRSMTGDDVLDLRFGLAAVVRLIILGMTKGGKAMLSTWAVTNGS